MGQGALDLVLALLIERYRPIMGIMSPAHFTPEKECYTVLFLHFFREVVIHARETIQRKQLRDRQLE